MRRAAIGTLRTSRRAVALHAFEFELFEPVRASPEGLLTVRTTKVTVAARRSPRRSAPATSWPKLEHEAEAITSQRERSASRMRRGADRRSRPRRSPGRGCPPGSRAGWTSPSRSGPSRRRSRHSFTQRSPLGAPGLPVRRARGFVPRCHPSGLDQGRTVGSRHERHLLCERRESRASVSSISAGRLPGGRDRGQRGGCRRRLSRCLSSVSSRIAEGARPAARRGTPRRGARA